MKTAFAIVFVYACFLAAFLGAAGGLHIGPPLPDHHTIRVLH